MKSETGLYEFERPIGFWLKRVDELLTARIDEAQRAHGLSRLEWQVVNCTAASGGITDDALCVALQPFAGRDALNAVIKRLADRRVVSAASGTWQLTEAGRELHRCASAAQKAIRERAMSGISEEEYRTTMMVLRKLAANLETQNAQ